MSWFLWYVSVWGRPSTMWKKLYVYICNFVCLCYWVCSVLYRSLSVRCFSCIRSWVLSATSTSRCLLYFSIWEKHMSFMQTAKGQLNWNEMSCCVLKVVTRLIIMSTGLTLIGLIRWTNFFTCSNVGRWAGLEERQRRISCTNTRRGNNILLVCP